VWSKRGFFKGLVGLNYSKITDFSLYTRWLDKNEDDGQIVRELVPAGESPMLKSEFSLKKRRFGFELCMHVFTCFIQLTNSCQFTINLLGFFAILMQDAAVGHLGGEMPLTPKS